jgi:hypothetical protein
LRPSIGRIAALEEKAEQRDRGIEVLRDFGRTESGFRSRPVRAPHFDLRSSQSAGGSISKFYGGEAASVSQQKDFTADATVTQTL